MTMFSPISRSASLIGDPTRTAILVALIDGRALTAGELARMAGVSPQTASAHLKKLTEGALIRSEEQGRHRYYTLAGPEVARAIEAIAAVSPPPQVRSLRQSNHSKALERARTCYDHLAGELGVALTEAMLRMEYLCEREGGYRVTDRGKIWLQRFGIRSLPPKANLDEVPHHIDWTVRKYHLAGPLAVVMMRRLFELEWIEKGLVPRSVRLTDRGRTAFREEFGLDPTLWA
ncbi:ArsR/SmtB family transcription factor [Cohnella zeiphila]|uniref:Winged helix-turn-helix transcriptional regulator n=1 Tax=Cohnella zeiphila TaxID=2761120 RepID=A0A7X0SMN0_9BACL|nr:winged helix-turn-helix domain-containing protein [Cohnella zeiphila]MBB6730563.1 winged helix-turn-helix transcriptional regulator [Cohnella zeiphila]